MSILPVRTDLFDDGKVMKIARDVGIKKAEAVGWLVRIWSLCQTTGTLDGNDIILSAFDVQTIDDYTTPKFGAALVERKWAVHEPEFDHIRFPDLGLWIGTPDRHRDEARIVKGRTDAQGNRDRVKRNYEKEKAEKANGDPRIRLMQPQPLANALPDQTEPYQTVPTVPDRPTDQSAAVVARLVAFGMNKGKAARVAEHLTEADADAAIAYCERNAIGPGFLASAIQQAERPWLLPPPVKPAKPRQPEKWDVDQIAADAARRAKQ